MTTENSFNPYAVPDGVLRHDVDTDGRNAVPGDFRVTATLVYTAEHVIETLTRYREHRGFGNIPKSLQLIAACVSAIAAISTLVNHQYLISVLIITSVCLIYGGSAVGNRRIRRNHRTSDFADDNLTVLLSDAGYHVTSERQNVQFAWQTFSKGCTHGILFSCGE